MISRNRVPGWLVRAIRVPDFLKSLGFDLKRSCPPMASNSHPFWQCMRGGHANVTITNISYHITHVYTRACICTRTPTRSHAFAYVRACMQASLHTSRPTFTRGRVYTCLHVHTYTPPLALPGRGVLPSQACDLAGAPGAPGCHLSCANPFKLHVHRNPHA